MRIRHSRALRVLAPALTAILVLGTMSPAAEADGLVTQTATVTVSSTMSYTATQTQDVSATASWGNPAITKTLTATLSNTDTETVTSSATVTQSATAATADLALATAQYAANFWATLQSQINAITQASINAVTVAAHALIPQVAPKQIDLYNQALAQAQAAVLARDGQPTGTADACGAPRFKSDGTQWACSFNDDFSGTKLDTSKWSTWNNVNYWLDSNVCYLDDSSHVAVANGSLNLSVTRLAANNTACKGVNGGVTPLYGAGLLHSKYTFSQTYGQFEARIKFAGGYGIHNDFWLYPDDVSSGDHAEIDIAEPSGSMPNTMYSAIHRTAPGGSTELGSLWSCDMSNWAGAYHTYNLLWSASTLQFTYDGKVCAVTPNTGEYSRKFYMILQVLADGGSIAPTANTPLPATMSVDYVKVWK